MPVIGRFTKPNPIQHKHQAFPTSVKLLVFFFFELLFYFNHKQFHPTLRVPPTDFLQGPIVFMKGETQ